ncbi:ABC transporter ATP-binding protein [Saccharothrix xinjiangensis]|uniref:ABC transporter ATP-binding protein n=1 Tax=Saccharothrix xinjiangensis TaxID=204798 RepID=A0ABV9YFF4_9PSEU
MTHLRCRGVRCEVAGRTVVSDVDLDVPPGRMLALVGTNGSGKSTLIRALAGLRVPAAGLVTVDGEDLHAFSARRRARTIAYVGQEEAPPEDLLVGELVALGRVPHRPPWAFGRAERAITLEALEAVGLAHAVDRRCDRLSGGERRRVMLARALAQECGLVLLDEPTNHLDIGHQTRLLETLRGLGRTVVAAMHDLPLAAAYFDRVAVLHRGALRTVDTASTALAPTTVEEVFAVAAARLTDARTGHEHLVLGPGAAPSRTVTKRTTP